MFLLILLLWYLFNARVNLEVSIIGLCVSLPVYGFCCKHMGYDPETDRKALRRLSGAVAYVGLLLWETVQSNLEVSRFVFSRRIEVEPQIVFFRTDLKTDLARVVLANSITLTPGTITVSLSENEYCVHCLNHHMADGIENSAFVRRLRGLEAD